MCQGTLEFHVCIWGGVWGTHGWFWKGTTAACLLLGNVRIASNTMQMWHKQGMGGNTLVSLLGSIWHSRDSIWHYPRSGPDQFGQCLGVRSSVWRCQTRLSQSVSIPSIFHWSFFHKASGADLVALIVTAFKSLNQIWYNSAESYSVWLSYSCSLVTFACSEFKYTDDIMGHEMKSPRILHRYDIPNATLSGGHIISRYVMLMYVNAKCLLNNSTDPHKCSDHL